MLVTLWQGCYQDTWQDSIVPEAFCHPAKFSRGLIHRIYRYLMEQGHIAAGTTVLDPFGGVALGALDAMTYGLRWLGVELEPKFVALGKKNLELWRQRYGFRQGTLVQGDSRQLRAILQCTGVQAVVGSPPYEGSVNGDHRPYGGIASPEQQGGVFHGTYGTTPGQLGAMPPGCVVGSPPWHGLQAGASVAGPSSGMWKGYDTGLRPREDGPIYASSEEHYGTTPGQLGAMPPGAVVSSPPWENALAGSETCSAPHDTNGTLKAQYKERPVGASYQDVSQRKRLPDGTWPRQRPEAFYNNLGITTGDTFWSASAQIMQELALLLPAGAVCAWVVKAYVKNKAIVPFPEQWLALCESHGFNLVEEIHASLVEDHGTQHTLFGEPQAVTTEKKSFFRRLAEKKGSPRIDHETVLIVQKAGDGGGVCCVSSPPYSASNQDYKSGWGYIDMEKRAAGDPGRYADASYGTTPGNLGNLPVGRR